MLKVKIKLKKAAIIDGSILYEPEIRPVDITVGDNYGVVVSRSGDSYNSIVIVQSKYKDAVLALTQKLGLKIAGVDRDEDVVYITVELGKRSEFPKKFIRLCVELKRSLG